MGGGPGHKPDILSLLVSRPPARYCKLIRLQTQQIESVPLLRDLLRFPVLFRSTSAGDDPQGGPVFYQWLSSEGPYEGVDGEARRIEFLG